MSLSGEISTNYGWEVTLFHKIRSYQDGVTFLETQINWDRYKADHCPRFTFHIIFLNCTILEGHVYYLHHRDSDIE